MLVVVRVRRHMGSIAHVETWRFGELALPQPEPQHPTMTRVRALARMPLPVKARTLSNIFGAAAQ